MNRLDRALGILLLLRSGAALSATELARRFEVSTRTIYRDVEALGMVGVPVYAERGRNGGFRLVEGYFLPPVMFTRAEAVSLLLAVTLLRNLRSRPFAADLELAEEKLLAAIPASLREVLAQARRVIGAEAAPEDAFHPEPEDPGAVPASGEQTEAESHTISAYLLAIMDGRAVLIRYLSPYRGEVEMLRVTPLGLFWDRDRWYLAVAPTTGGGEVRLCRADRVLDIRPLVQAAGAHPDFDVRDLLGREWLRPAMELWAEDAPVKIRLGAEQVARLRKDWYYRHARFEPEPAGRYVMTFGEEDRQRVFDLLRWLGPGAELLEPAHWRAGFRAELLRMAALYEA